MQVGCGQWGPPASSAEASTTHRFKVSDVKSSRLPEPRDHGPWGHVAVSPRSPRSTPAALGLCSDSQLKAPGPRCQVWNFNPGQNGRFSHISLWKSWTPSAQDTPRHPGLDGASGIQVDGVAWQARLPYATRSRFPKGWGTGKDPDVLLSLWAQDPQEKRLGAGC